MMLKGETYKGYPIKFTDKSNDRYKMVIGEFPSKITGRILGTQGTTKEMVYNKCKQMIDKEQKVKGLS